VARSSLGSCLLLERGGSRPLLWRPPLFTTRGDPGREGVRRCEERDWCEERVCNMCSVCVYALRAPIAAPCLPAPRSFLIRSPRFEGSRCIVVRHSPLLLGTRNRTRCWGATVAYGRRVRARFLVPGSDSEANGTLSPDPAPALWPLPEWGSNRPTMKVLHQDLYCAGETRRIPDGVALLRLEAQSGRFHVPCQVRSGSAAMAGVKRNQF
jgi:hypothetical protein